jgi:hypothetical protein
MKHFVTSLSKSRRKYRSLFTSVVALPSTLITTSHKSFTALTMSWFISLPDRIGNPSATSTAASRAAHEVSTGLLVSAAVDGDVP